VESVRDWQVGVGPGGGVVEGTIQVGSVSTSVVSVKPVFVFVRGVACTLLLIASASCLVTVNKDLIRRPSAFAARADTSLDLRLDWTHLHPSPVLSCATDSTVDHLQVYLYLTSESHLNKVHAVMAPKGGSGKKESGRAKKAENEANKRAAAEEAKVRISLDTRAFLPPSTEAYILLQERAEASKWVDGGKSSKSKEEKEEKRKAELARKAENARLLAEEEAQAKKASAKAGAKKAASAKTKPAGPGAIAADDAPVAPAGSAEGSTKNGDEPQEVESFSATGIDNALDLLEVVTAKMDKASVGNQAASTIEKHPEVRTLAFPKASFCI
jgi:hypothetical protein